MAAASRRNSDETRDTFVRHTERMNQFGKAHTSLRDDGTERGNRMSADPCSAMLSHAVSLSGGARVATGNAAWSNLVGIWKVTLRRFSCS